MSEMAKRVVDRLISKIAAPTSSALLKEINKVRKTFKPTPKEPLTEADLKPVLSKITELEKTLKDVFGAISISR